MGEAKPYGSKYLLRKCLEYNLLSFGGLSTFSDSVWIHRESCTHNGDLLNTRVTRDGKPMVCEGYVSIFHVYICLS